MPPWTSQRVQQQHQQQHQHHSNSHGSRFSHNATTTPPPFRQAGSSLRVASSSHDLPIDLISSPSRGLDSSDSSRDLTNEDTQARYRDHISERIKAHCSKYGSLCQEGRPLFPYTLPMRDPGKQKWCADGLEGASLGSLQDILLLVRRLREGCVAAGRHDTFALDVYALSTLLSIIVGDDIQLSSSLPRQVDMLQVGMSHQDDITAKDIQLLLGQTSGLSTTPDRTHTVSLYLLWLSVSGGQVSRIGGGKTATKMPSGAWLRERDRVLPLLDEVERQSPEVQMVMEVQAAVARDNVIRLHHILTTSSYSVWHQALLRRAVDRLRSSVWATLTKAYLHAPLDGRLLDRKEKAGDDWLEKTLLVDLALMPEMLPAESKNQSSTEAVPDVWDDSIEQVTNALESTSLQEPRDILTIQIRAKRLTAVFDAFQLPESSLEGNSTGPLSKWAGRKILQGGTPNIKLR